MKKPSKYLQDFEVDKLTNSITNTVSGDSFVTNVSLLVKDDLKQLQKKNGWLFDWQHELKQNDREIYKLIIANSPKIVQGATSLSIKRDHVFIYSFN